ncbi:putative cytochrome P450 monooxygenase [Talaromyces proteolyticus]|uniref:Cytochrome P450 monooxygenase n=1 Tax=Talaromyces proteolyticus TaxID=1131652 RepID=A0AAD4PWT2_9EURO|nr:putative cytochrome P450 monooxygenase [Talaromyces proteolyticus]KAH8691979.1 putative cytochrome P450 monooxygenase [Talaromyces proteolyticus]
MHPFAFLVAASLGVATHVFHFHEGEHHLHPQRYIQVVLLLFLSGAAYIKYLEPCIAITAAALFSVKLLSIYLSGIYLSLVIYRLFFNPLNKFPGHFLARLTAFHHVFQVAPKKDMYRKLYDSHQRLGNFVRTGPNDLSVADADVVRVAFAPQSVCTKAPWYSIELPAYSLHTTRSHTQHNKRRRIWSPAFSDKALRSYEQRVLKYNKILIDQLATFSGKPVDMSKWFSLWSFDVMGDLAFGRSFNMLNSADGHWAIKLLNEGQDMVGFAFPTWFTRLLWHTPGAQASYRRFMKFCAERIEERMAVQGKQLDPDITHYLIEDFNAQSKEEQKRALHSLHLDSRLIIVAGSDTTAATLTYMFYHIAAENGLLSRLRQEVEPAIGSDGTIEHKALQASTLLNGCINETLRLHPPVPSGLYRKTPPEGVYVGKEFIPGNTVIQAHLYSIGHSESHFVQADAFIPERFSSRPELIKHKDAFAPFSMGPYGCIGKALAYMEIRMLTAYLITEFDISFAPGEDGRDLLSKTVDHFTVSLGPLNLCFARRR